MATGIGVDSTMTLLLNDPVDEASIAELVSIFNHWTLDLSALFHLTTKV